MKIIISSIITFAILIAYITMPTIAYGFFGLPVLVLLASAGILLLLPENKIAIVISGISIVAAIILPIITSWSFFFANDYHKLLEKNDKVITTDFSKDISPVDISKIRVVDQKLAAKLGDKVLGEDMALGSIVDVGEFNIQAVNGKLYWVAPLLHSGFFKWTKSDYGTPGYIKVSATNENDVQLILNKGNIKYQPAAFFGDNLKRHIYLNGYITQGFTDFSFEINDEGKPFWVVTKFKKTIGYLGSDAVGTIIVDATNGDIKEYTIDKTPKWVDRIQPEEFVVTQLDNWGIYKKGWLNAVFTKEEIMHTTKGTSLVYGKDGRSYWYTGMTSVGSDGATIGFVLVDTRNKKTSFYKVSGATEQKAMRSAEGIVQEKGYDATFPVLYNVLGTPTYILTLKDREGLVKKVAMVNVANYSIVGLGVDTKSALRSYRSRLLSKGNNISIDSKSDTLKTLESKVIRINQDVKNGNTYYYIRLEGNTKTFILDSSLSEDIVLTHIGDEVIITFENTDMKYISISSFENVIFNSLKNTTTTNKIKK